MSDSAVTRLSKITPKDRDDRKRRALAFIRKEKRLTSQEKEALKRIILATFVAAEMKAAGQPTIDDDQYYNLADAFESHILH